MNYKHFFLLFLGITTNTVHAINSTSKSNYSNKIKHDTHSLPATAAAAVPAAAEKTPPSDSFPLVRSKSRDP